MSDEPPHQLTLVVVIRLKDTLLAEQLLRFITLIRFRSFRGHSSPKVGGPAVLEGLSSFRGELKVLGLVQDPINMVAELVNSRCQRNGLLFTSVMMLDVPGQVRQPSGHDGGQEAVVDELCGSIHSLDTSLYDLAE